MEIKETRLNLNMSQDELAKLIGVSSRTIRRYESGQIDKYKKEHILKVLSELARVDEEHGILKQEDIIKGVEEVASNHDVEFVYLFGSYAKGKATEISDVDLMIKTNEKGLSYFGLVEELRTKLKKKIDLIRVDELSEKEDLLIEIFRDGVKIYSCNQE